jgi:hypothetical protein
MYQMCILITYISLVMLNPVHLEIRNIVTVKTQKDCREMEPNPSKDITMHEGDNSSFWYEFIDFNVFLIVEFIFVFSST